MYQMSLSKEESSMSADSTINLMEAVNGLHWRNSLEIHKLLKENEDFCVCFCSEVDSPQKIDVEKLAAMLPRHLIAVIISSTKDKKFEYLLCGIRLLHTLCDLTSRHAKLEQVLLDDVKISEQMLDLVIFSMIVLGGNRKVSYNSDGESLLHATLVASSLYLLHGFISPHYQELVQVLLAHPKVNIFIDAAFGAVHNVVRSLQKKLMSRRSEQPIEPDLCSSGSVNFHCQQAEAALQFIHSLCQHKLFRELIAKNKELCGNGGVLMLAQSILSLTVSPEFVGSTITLASLSRMKAKVLSILQHLFEAESVSFLDEVASAGNLHLAKTIASEVLELLRLGLSKASKSCDSHEYPMGFVLLNAMRLADVLTDDSNFRSFFTENFSKVLSAVFSLSHGDFLSMLCSSDLPSREDDAIIDYDLYTSVGWVLSLFSSFEKPVAPQLKLNSQNNLTMSSYAHQRTSLLIKMIANLHCFVPNLCKEQDRNRFIQNFMSGLQKDPSSIMANLLPALSYTPMAQRGTGVCKNLRSLVRHAESLIPNSLNEEDFLLLRVFFDQLQPLIRSEFQENQVQATQDTGGYAFANQRKELLNLDNGNTHINEEAVVNPDVQVEAAEKQAVNLHEELERITHFKENDADTNNLETSGSDTSSTRGKSPADQVEDGELLKTSSKRCKGNVSAEVKDEDKTETNQGIEKQRRKRKRSIMNDNQIGMIERALVDEPDMQRNSSSIQSWADKLSQNGSEVTSSQLKNWLNNRKAKLARANKQAGPGPGPGPVRDSSGDLGESPGEENTWQKASTSAKGSNQGGTRSVKPSGENATRSISSEKRVKLGQDVVLMDERGEEVGNGRVMRVEGEWNGLNLETRQVCVVDVVVLSTRDWTKILPFVSDDVGVMTFQEAYSRFGGVVRVTWDVNKLR